MIRSPSRILAAMLILGACAAEEPPPPDDLPLPPEPPARVQSARAAAARARPADAEPVPAPEPGPAASGVRVQEPPPAPPPAPPQGWRVMRDGTLGCADPAPLRLLRQGGDRPPRLLAEARAAGGCRTTFRVNAWTLDGTEDDVVRLRLVNGEALTLWFLRADVVAP